VRWIIAIMLFTLAANVFAQQDSVSTKSQDQKTYVGKLRETLHATTEKLTISKAASDTLKNPNQKLDSLNNVSQHLEDSISSIQVGKNLDNKADSLQNKITKPLDAVNASAARIDGKLNHKTDSLSNLAGGLTKLPGGIQNKSDSLQSTINSLNKKISNTERKLQSKTDSLQNKISTSITRTTEKAAEKIKSVTEEKLSISGTEKLNLQSANTPDLKTNGLDLSGNKLPGINEKLPDVNLGNVNTNLKTDLPNVDNLDLDKGLPDVKTELSKVDLPKVDELNKVKDISSQANQIDNKLAGAEKYEGDLRKLKDGDELNKLPDEAESQLKNVGQVKALNGEAMKAKQFQAQQQAIVQRYRDKQLMQEEITRKATNVANDYITKNAGAVKEGQAQLAESKKTFGNIKSFKDVFKKRSDELEGKKIYERLVPGITFQIYNNNIFAMDMATQIGYRVSPRFTAGVGLTYRTGFDKQFKYYATNLGMGGVRTYFDFAALKGIYVHAEYEYLRVNPNRFVIAPKSEEPIHFVSSSYFGIGKKMNLSRRIKGSILALYRVEYDGHIPSMNKFNMRIGFDYVIRKQRKITGPK
jgi:hypothetical protein